MIYPLLRLDASAKICERHLLELNELADLGGTSQ